MCRLEAGNFWFRISSNIKSCAEGVTALVASLGGGVVTAGELFTTERDAASDSEKLQTWKLVIQAFLLSTDNKYRRDSISDFICFKPAKL